MKIVAYLRVGTDVQAERGYGWTSRSGPSEPGQRASIGW